MQILTLLAALGAALIAGTFFAFSSFIMAALAKLPVPQGMAAMQQINIAVINPVFMGVFLGTALLCVLISGWMAYSSGLRANALLFLGAALYVFGSFMLTLLANVPLNNALAAADPASSEGAALWGRYLSEWTFWNHIRSAASLGASAMLFRAWFA